MMKVVLLLALLTASEGSTVVGRAGGEVTLSCKYDIGLQGALSICWGRGALPASGCGGQLLSTDGQRVKDGSPASGRYRLLGALGAGDVSLTISNLTGADEGRYGCRVEVPGWFNDHKNHLDLRVEDAPQTTSSSWTSSPWETASNATGHVTSSQRLATSSSSIITAEVSSSVSPVLVWVLVWVLVGSASLVSVVVLVITLSRRRLARSALVPGLVRFWSSSSGLQLHSGESAVENIYQMDEGANGGGYEYLP
ncbi:T-cell immunoglobulin and mucin domain-containing protein 4-like isoform X2 [Pseudoliparis swirei]|uniref:T-cell immunoglobulin and mucin domain-containing protein 4-like isoform X2 n=1 Tax=Pseudoliparis swirei TaxID=2059687 RepID=UPI0024BED3FA|nr:T-cell immunoglobulin and mucin domain-containing protein 4-like isoform X2 [Pseudoliparis swirei]